MNSEAVWDIRFEGRGGGGQTNTELLVHLTAWFVCVFLCVNLGMPNQHLKRRTTALTQK